MNNKTPTERANELYHHGIKGQKWGVRRYQNADGSLTALGKTRYYTDEDSKAGYEMAKKQIKIGSDLTSSGRRVGGRTIDNDAINEAGAFLRGQSDALTDEFNSICTKIADQYKTLNTNEKFKNEIMSELKRDFVAGDQVDDREFLEWEIDGYIDNVANKYMSDDIKRSWDNLTKGIDIYYDNVKSITEDIVGQCGDMTVDSVRKGLFDKTEYKYADVVEHSLHELGKSVWVRYLNNNTEMAYYEGDSYTARQEIVTSIADEFMKTKSN